MQNINEKALAVTAEVSKAVLGKPEVVLKIMMAILARGHVLIEDIPGVGKTTLAQAFARAMDLTQNRVQFTPDVLPSDIVGFSLYQKETGKFVYHPGAVMCNLFLADEINRTSARTQSALLEVMEESAVTVDGVTRVLPQPFTVFATENPVGSVGTQMLPESQLDRFMVCVVMGYPDAEAEMEILSRQPRRALLDRVQPVMDKNDLLAMQQQVDEVYMSDEIRRYIVELSRATRRDSRLTLGLSPRASLAVAGMARAAAFLGGRNYVAPQDITAIFADAARHRLCLTEQARTGGDTVQNILDDVLHTVPRPARRNRSMAGKVGCALLLAVLFAAAAVSRTSFAVFLASLAVLLVGFLAWYVRTLRRDVTVTLQLPARPVHPDEDFAVLVKLHNNGRRPMPELRVVLQAVDAESGTAIELPCGAMLAPHQCADLRVTLRAAKSGLWRFRVREATVRDLLGLFAAHCAVPPQSRELCVLPPAEGEDDGAGTKPQNCAEKVTAAGCDLTDGVYDLRPYRAGDSPKLIHWKLTARVGELTVREPLGAAYRADPAGSVLAEGANAPQQQLLHFGQAAVKRLRRLTRRKDTDPATGLVFVDRVLLPRTKAAAHPMAETAADLLISELLALGLLTALNGAFALALPIWVWLGVAALCAAWPALHRVPLSKAGRYGAALALAVGYLVLLFAVQQPFLAGAAQCADAVRLCLNTRFNANFVVSASPVSAQMGLFALLTAVPFTMFLATLTARHTDALLLGAVLLPIVVFTLLAGTGRAVLGWLLLLPGWLGSCAAARSLVRKRLWRGKDSAVYAANLQTHRTNQRLAGVGMAAICAVLFLPALALRPVLMLPLNALQPVTDKVCAAGLSAAIEWLPKISGGALNFHVSATAGGVEDGSLTRGDGLALTGLEDIMVTTDAKPEETVYLRGFIGVDYDGTSWQAGNAAAFDSAAANWKTDGDGRLAIANLPFLRAAYSGAQPQQMTVQRLHANDAYTFAPYNAYFNDYYTPDGDGAIAGQTVQDDMFYYFPRKQAEELLAARDDDDAGVLDRLESAYAAYVRARCLDVPDGAGYDAIDKELAALVKERKLRDDDIDGRRALVRSWLNEHCRYSADAETPDDTDPLLYFLSESHTGSSTQFASAAVLLCRMVGLPARYVVGYAAPQSLFTSAGDGSCRAVLQDDNAHAWAEIYLSGQGWTPLEVTPGMTAELTEGELAADAAQAGQNAADSDTPLLARQEADSPAETPQSVPLLWVLPTVLLLLVLALALLRRARRTPLQTVQAEFCALHRKMRRCGLAAEVSSDEAAFAEFLQTHCPQTDRETVQHLLDAVQAAQFAPDPCTVETAQEIQTLCRKLRKKLCRRTV